MNAPRDLGVPMRSDTPRVDRFIAELEPLPERGNQRLVIEALLGRCHALTIIARELERECERKMWPT